MELSVNLFVSLDGVMQGPGAVSEDPSNDFIHGGWLVPFADADMGRIVEQEWFAKAGAIVLGRRTFELMRAYWSQVTDPDNRVAVALNTYPKYVASASCQTPIPGGATRLCCVQMCSSSCSGSSNGRVVNFRCTAVGSSSRRCTAPACSIATVCSSSPPWSVPASARSPPGPRLPVSPWSSARRLQLELARSPSSRSPSGRAVSSSKRATNRRPERSRLVATLT